MIECRGRNGWFEFHHFYALVPSKPAPSWIDIYSKSKLAQMPPIVFSGPQEELIKLFEDILEKLR